MNRTLLAIGAASLSLACAFTTGCSSSSTSDNTATDAGGAGDGAATGTLYARLGEHSGIASAISAIVAQELMDTEISAFFGNLGSAGHPTAAQLEACFTDLLSVAAGGTAEMYPTTESGFTCRSMKDAHASLHIPQATFDKFVSIAAAELKTLGVADADIQTIGGVLNGTATDIVDPTAVADAGPG